MVIMTMRAVYIGPMVFSDGAFVAHFTTATEAAQREGNGIEVLLPDLCERVSLTERLRRLHAMRASGEWVDFDEEAP